MADRVSCACCCCGCDRIRNGIGAIRLAITVIRKSPPRTWRDNPFNWLLFVLGWRFLEAFKETEDYFLPGFSDQHDQSTLVRWTRIGAKWAVFIFIAILFVIVTAYYCNEVKNAKKNTQDHRRSKTYMFATTTTTSDDDSDTAARRRKYDHAPSRIRSAAPVLIQSDGESGSRRRSTRSQPQQQPSESKSVQNTTNTEQTPTTTTAATATTVTTTTTTNTERTPTTRLSSSSATTSPSALASVPSSNAPGRDVKIRIRQGEPSNTKDSTREEEDENDDDDDETEDRTAQMTRRNPHSSRPGARRNARGGPGRSTRGRSPRRRGNSEHRNYRRTTSAEGQ